MLLTDRRAYVAGALLLAACSPSHPGDGAADAATGDDAASCSVGILGDPDADPVLEITTPSDVDGGGDIVLGDGGVVVLAAPPQGGRVIFAGARATNIDGCEVQMTGVLRDPTSHEVRLDSRTVNLIADGDGWGTSALAGVPADAQLSSYSNIPVCPNEWATTDLYGKPFELVLTLQDRRGKMVSTTVAVTPQCPDDDIVPACACICALDYVLGASCPAASIADAGGE